MRSHEQLETVELELESRSVAEEWSALAQRCPDATAFLHPAWSSAWHAHLGRDVEPRVIGVRAGGTLIGLAPLALSRDGALAPMGGDITDYSGVLAIPSAHEAVASAILAHVAGMEWTRCELARLELGSPLLGCTAPSLAITAVDQDVCPHTPIPRGARSLTDVIPSGFARRVAQSIRVAERAGRIERTWAGAIEERVETWLALHEAWWRARGGEGVLASDRVRSFWRAVAPPLARIGWLRVLEVRLEREPIASSLVLAANGRFMFYLGGMAPEAAKLSPGRLAIAELFRRAIAEGAREVDFLRGVEPYKYDWGAQDRWTRTLRVERRRADSSSE